LATFRELKSQMAEHEKQAAAARAAEFEEVLADIRAKVAEYGYSERDIFRRGRGRPRNTGTRRQGDLVRQRAAAGVDQARKEPRQVSDRRMTCRLRA
jgi:DNA-binding protein H-NS